MRSSSSDKSAAISYDMVLREGRGGKGRGGEGMSLLRSTWAIACIALCQLPPVSS